MSEINLFAGLGEYVASLYESGGSITIEPAPQKSKWDQLQELRKGGMDFFTAAEKVGMKKFGKNTWVDPETGRGLHINPSDLDYSDPGSIIEFFGWDRPEYRQAGLAQVSRVFDPSTDPIRDKRSAEQIAYFDSIKNGMSKYLTSIGTSWGDTTDQQKLDAYDYGLREHGRKTQTSGGGFFSKALGFVKSVVGSITSVIGDVFKWVGDSIGDVTDFVFNDILKPIGSFVGDTITTFFQDPLSTVAKLAATFTGNAWAIPLINGATVAINGGDIGDVLLASAKSYIGQVIGSEFSNYTDAGAGALQEVFGEQLGTVIAGGATQAAIALVTGEDPVDAFIRGGIVTGVGAIMGEVNDELSTTVGDPDFELAPVAQNLIGSTLTALVTGQDITPELIASATARGVITGNIVQKYASELGLDLEENSNELNAITYATQSALGVILSGGNGEQMGLVLKQALNNYGYAEFADVLRNTDIKSEIGNFVGKLTGDYQDTEFSADEISELQARRQNEYDKYEELRYELEEAYTEILAEESRILALPTGTVAQQDAYNAAVAALNAKIADYETLYDLNTREMGQLEANYEGLSQQIARATEDYDSAAGEFQNSLGSLNEELKPLVDATLEAITFIQAPDFNPDEYREMYQVPDGVSVYEDFQKRLVDYADGNTGAVFANREAFDAALKNNYSAVINKVFHDLGINPGSVSSDTLSELARIIRDAGENGAGFTPAFLSEIYNSEEAMSSLTVGVQQVLARDPANPDASATVNADTRFRLAQLGVDVQGLYVLADGSPLPDEWKALLYTNGATAEPRLIIGGELSDEDIASNSYQFTYDPDTGKLLVDTALADAVNNSIGWWDPSKGYTNLSYSERVYVLADGSKSADQAVVITGVLPDTGGTGGSGGTWGSGATWGSGSSWGENTSRSEDNSPELVNAGVINNAAAETKPSLNTTLELLASLDTQPTTNQILNQIKDDPDFQRAAEELGGADNAASFVSKVFDIAKTTNLPDSIINLAANALKAGGGFLQSMNGLVAIAGIAPPDTKLYQFAETMIKLGTAGNTDEYKAELAKLQEYMNSAPDIPDGASWYESALLGAQHVFGGLYESPTMFLAEYIGVEALQELAPLAIGGLATMGAKASLRFVGTELSAKAAATAGISAAAATDLAESFGGSATEAYDTAYDMFKNKLGMTHVQARDKALELSVQAGLLNTVITAATMGVGGLTDGLALEKAILGKNTDSGVFASTAEELMKRAGGGAYITSAEGIQESIEEGAVAAFVNAHLAAYNPQLIENGYPPINVAAETGAAFTVGALIGSSTAVSVLGFEQTGDLLSNISGFSNPGVASIINNSPNTAAGINGAKAAFEDLGITGAAQNNLLNSISDLNFTSTAEFVDMFGSINPDFEISADQLTQFTDLRGNQAESINQTWANNYVDERYIDVQEVIEQAANEGITLTEEQAQEYVRQLNGPTQDAAKEELRSVFDPLATTYDEARKFFYSLGYTPSADEINSFVGETSEAEQEQAIAAYVDPLFTDEAEARQFFESLGYTPTQQEINSFVGQIREDQQETAIEEYTDPRLVTEDEVIAAYEQLGLTRPTEADIQSLIGQYAESELEGRAEEYLPTARYNSVMKAIDDISDGAYSGEVSPELQEALDIVRNDVLNALGDLGLEVAVIDQTTRDITEAIGNVASGDAEASGLYGYIDDAVQKLQDAGLTQEQVRATVEGVVGDAVSDLGGQLDSSVGNILEVLGAPATDDTDATGIYGYIDNAVNSLGVTLADIQATLGTPAEYDENGNLITAPTGTYARIADLEAQGLTTQQAIAQLAVDLGVSFNTLSTALTQTEERLTGEIGEVSENLGSLSLIIGEPGVRDNPLTEEDESKDPTGLFGVIANYEKAGIERDEAISQSLDDLAAQLGVTRSDILDRLGLTEQNLTNQIDVLEQNFTEQLSATEEELNQKIAETETTLGTQLTETEQELTEEIEAVGELVGKPAQEVTATDIDFVIDLLAGEQALTENLLAQYDVNGDNLLTIDDQLLLEQLLAGDNVFGQLGPESVYAPTGVYEAVQDTQTQLENQMQQNQDQTIDAITQMEQNIRNQNTDIARRQGVQNFLQMAMGAADASGQQVSVKAPDPVQLKYVYDFQDIFATPQQAGMFISPYGSYNRGAKHGGKVESTTDELLRLIGE
jgi:hypothetical protein